MPSVGPGRGGKPLTGVDGPVDGGWISEREVRDRGSRWRMCGAKGFLSPARKRVLTRSGSLSGFDFAK